MKIAFFTISYRVEMYRSLILELSNNGHEVYVINPVFKEKSSFRNENGFKLLSFRSFKMLNVGLVRKGIANLLFPYLCILSLKRYIKKPDFDLIIMSTPPLAYYSPIRYLKRKNRKHNVKLYLILRDIHPEGARFVGLDKIKPLYNYFRKIEMNLYKMSDYIGCMSPGNITFIADRNKYIENKRIRLLPNWEKQIEFTQPAEDLVSKYGLNNKYVVLYGGNMGIPQNLEILLKLADEKKKYKDVLFLLIGEGTEKKKLKSRASEMGLNNVVFFNSIPRSEYNDLMKICSVGFISLHPEVPIPNIPSKTLSYFNAKLSILAAIDSVTDYGEYLLNSFNAGLFSNANDFEQLSQNFDKLYFNESLRKEMGENGYNSLQTHFSPYSAYLEIITAVQNEN